MILKSVLDVPIMGTTGKMVHVGNIDIIFKSKTIHLTSQNDIIFPVEPLSLINGSRYYLHFGVSFQFSTDRLSSSKWVEV